MAVSVVGVVTLAIILASAHWVSGQFTRSMIVGWAAIVTLLLIPLIVIRTRNVVLAGAIFSTASLAGVITACFLNGGLEAHFLINLPIVSVLTGWLVGGRAGIAACVVSVGAIIFMGTPLGAHWVSPSALAPAQLETMRIVTAISATASALIMVRCFRLASSQALSDIKASRDAAARANRAKSVFLANMSHELRTPLNGVIAVAGTLNRTDLTPSQREMVGLITSSGQTLERLLTDVLDVSKIEAGRLEVEQVEFDLRKIVQSTVDLFVPMAQEKGIVLSADITTAANGYYLGDPTRIRQIVTNLLSNAVKFTSQGSVRLTVDVETKAAGSQTIHISVEDTGVGFDASVADTLFDPFIQEDSSIARRFGGSGLGLFICKSLVEDHPTNRKIVELILSPLNIEMTSVEDGEQALAAFAEKAFDVILMDMQMPVMDGISATREIRRQELLHNRPRTPIAMLTANAMDGHVQNALDAGADKHIAKPVTPERLIDEVSELLKRYGHAKGLAA